MDRLSILGNVLLFLLVFGMSATVDIDCMRQQIRNKNAILLGIFCQFLLLPFLGFLTVKLLKLDNTIGITLLVVTSSPGGSYSNWWCSMFNADLALSVTMTAISTLLSIITLPVNLLVYVSFAYGGGMKGYNYNDIGNDDVTRNLDWASLFMSLSVVISAIVLGLFVSWKFHSYKFNSIINKVGNIAGLALVIFSATMTNTGDADSKIWSRDWPFYVSCIGPCILGLIISSFLASLVQLKKPERM
jgi:predicted Na+-dependent transporter